MIEISFSELETFLIKTALEFEECELTVPFATVGSGQVLLSQSDWGRVASCIHTHRQRNPFNPVTQEKINYDAIYDRIWSEACPREIRESKMQEVPGPGTDT